MLRLLKILIETNLFIAIAAVCFLIANVCFLDLQVKSIWYLMLHVFFSTWFVYQISRWIYFQKGEYINQEELVVQWFQKHPNFNKITILCSGILAIIFMLFLKFKTIVVLFFIGGISVLYPIPVFKLFGSNTKLRDFPFVKIFLIAIVWSTTSVVLPALEANIDLHQRIDVWLLFIAQFIFILFITLPFDINDISSDKLSNVKTIPTFFGIKTAKIICLLLGIIYSFAILFLFMLENWNHMPNKYLSDASIILIWLLMILLQVYTFVKSATAPKWLIKVVYDGSMILYFLILFFTTRNL